MKKLSALIMTLLLIVSTSPTGLQPQNENDNANILTNSILLVQADVEAPPGSHEDAHQLHNYINDLSMASIKSHIENYDAQPPAYSQRYAEIKYDFLNEFPDGPNIDGIKYDYAGAGGYKQTVLDWIKNKNTTATNRKNAAIYVLNELLGISTINKDDLVENFAIQIDSNLFSPDFGNYPGIKSYFQDASTSAVSLRPNFNVTHPCNSLSCPVFDTGYITSEEYLDAFIERRKNYAAYKIYEAVNESYDTSGSTGLSLILAAISAGEGVKNYYSEYKPVEESGVTAMSNVISRAIYEDRYDSVSSCPSITSGSEVNLPPTNFLGLINDAKIQITLESSYVYDYDTDYDSDDSASDFPSAVVCTLFKPLYSREDFYRADITPDFYESFSSPERLDVFVTRIRTAVNDVKRNPENLQNYRLATSPEYADLDLEAFIGVIKSLDQSANQLLEPSPYCSTFVSYDSTQIHSDPINKGLISLINLLSEHETVDGQYSSSNTAEVANGVRRRDIDANYNLLDETALNLLVQLESTVGSVDYALIDPLFTHIFLLDNFLISNDHVKLLYEDADALITADSLFPLFSDALVYDAAKRVATADNPSEKADQIMLSVNAVTSVFAYSFLYGQYDDFKENYIQCYDLDSLGFTTPSCFDDSFTASEIDSFPSYCSANFVQGAFVYLNYESLVRYHSLSDSSGGVNHSYIFSSMEPQQDSVGSSFFSDVLEQARIRLSNEIDSIVVSIISESVPSFAEIHQTSLTVISEAGPDKIVGSEGAAAATTVASTASGFFDDNPQVLDIDFNQDSSAYISRITEFISVVNDAAIPIIDEAERDIDILNAVYDLVYNWNPAPPPSMEFTILGAHSQSEPVPALSAIFSIDVTIKAEDSRNVLSGVEITATDTAGKLGIRGATGNRNEITIKYPRSSSDSGDTVFPISSMSCNPGGDECSMVVKVIALDYENSDITLKLTVILEPSTPSTTESKKIFIPDTTPPVINSVELLSVTEGNTVLGEIYPSKILTIQVTASDPVDPNLESIHIKSVMPTEATFNSGSDVELCSNPTDDCVVKFLCSRNLANTPGQCAGIFELTVPPGDEAIQPLREIELDIVARDATSIESKTYNWKKSIHSRSIPGCQNIDLGTKRNKYDLKLIYAWANSPNINHVITGTLVANSPD